MNKNSIASAADQVGDRTAAAQEKPRLPSLWWVVAACLLAGIAIAVQAWSVLGHLGLWKESIRLTELRGQIVDLEGEIGALKTQRSQLQTDLAKSGPALDDLRKQIAIESAKLADARTEREKAEKAANDKDAQAKVSSAECEALTVRIGQLKQEKAKLDEENRILSTLHTKLETDIASDRGRWDQLRDQLRVDGDEVLKQQETLSGLVTQVGTKTAEVKQLTDDQERLKKENAERTAKNDALIINRDDLQKQVAEQDAKLKGIAADITREQETRAGLVTQVGTKRAEVKQLTDDQDRIKKENSQLTANNDTLRTTHGDLVKQVAEQDAKLKGIADDITREQDKLLRLLGEAKAIPSAITVLKAEHDIWQTKVDAAKKELNDLKMQIETQAALAEAKRKELQGLEIELKAKQAEYDETVLRIGRARQDETSLLKQIEDLRAASTRTETMRPAEEPLPPPTPPPPSPSEPDAGKPADGTVPPGKPEPTEPPKQ